MSSGLIGSPLIVGTNDARWLEIENGRIAHIDKGEPPRGVVDQPGLLVPGLIDLQINGLGSVNFATAEPEEWRTARLELLRHGVTGFCPTFASAPIESYRNQLLAAERARRDESAGATVIGVHLEGPFLGSAPGAHPPELLRSADTAWLKAQLVEHPGLISIVTLAPEADPGFEAISLLSNSGVLVSLGHSLATYDEARRAADAGARAVTHLFNAMGSLHQREPGLIGAALDDERLTSSLIADLVHVHPAVLRLAIHRKRNIALVSDAVGVGSRSAPDERLRIETGTPRLADGTLAGSLLTLDVAIRNLVGIGVPLERAVEMASTIPAEILGLPDRGRIEVGMRADLVLLDPKTFEVLSVWMEGEKVHG
jgi:N-acetylglucosamine-6-phosphate deacetylase